MESEIVYKLILALLLGAFIGLERQIHEKGEQKVGQRSFLGLRTFALITPLGAIAGLVYAHNPLLFLVISIAFVLLTLGYYAFDSFFSKDIGITTEIALLYNFIIGVLITTNILPLQVLIGLTVVLGLILSRKEIIKQYVSGIGQEQMASLISYLVIALVILPLLPNVSYKLSDIPQLLSILSSFGIHLGSFTSIEVINPFKLWLIVALITGVDVFGYILEKTIGQKKGWLLTSFAGGFVSSTATTGSLALQSKNSGSIDHLVAAAVVSNLASFLQHMLIILPLSLLLFTKLIPAITLMIFSSLLITLFFFKKGKLDENIQATKESLKKTKLFNLFPALKFALLFLFIRLFAQIALQIFGEGGFFVSMALGAIPGMDAVLISIAELAGKTITFTNALWAFVLANAVNLFVKSFYSFINGKKEFAVKFSISTVIIILSSILGLAFSL